MQLTPAQTPRPLSALLRAGGIFYDVEATAKNDVLREFVARLPLPAAHNRRALVAALQAREAKSSTGIGAGIAIPHLGNSAILFAEDAFLSLCLLARAIDFDAVDRNPVHALFIVVSPNPTAHLRILGQLALTLRDAEFGDLLRSRAPVVDIIARMEALEATRIPTVS
jgi:mannitol/fructose-specific phosphotransferase system IIA component (Ntr-type)